MSAPQRSSFSPEATAAFAEIVARHDRGEAIDFEAEFRTHEDVATELRALHDNWKRLDRLLGGMQVGESAIDELERDLKRRDTPPDEATRADLERLSSPERARKRYTVRERLARGGMGEIWRVHDADLDRDLAMKVIRTRAGDGSKTPDGKLLRRFLFEARLTGRLDHPGIVPVHDIGVDTDGRLYFTMPLVRGRSLAEILDLARDDRRNAYAKAASHEDDRAPMGASEAWTRSRVLEVVLKVCDALAYAHAQGVVHRDLKPANVMVGRFGETYVMDWGLARVLSELDEIDRGEVLGTPAYMAPEQAKGKLDDVGPRSDVYALGSILYHLLAGRMPYADHDTHAGRDLLEAVRAGPPPKLEDVAPDAPPELVAIAKKAMVRSPDGRYADMGAMAADLRAYMEGRVVRAHEQGAWPALRKWFARNRVVASITLGSGALLVAVALWFSYAQGRSAGEILRLSDLRRVEDLEARAEALWPASPSIESELRAWLTEAEALAARAPAHERELKRLREEASRATGEARDELEWQVGALSELATRLSRFRDPFPGIGAIASVRRRLEDARRWAHASLEDATIAWNATCFSRKASW